jgi:hypothetical protein
MNENTAKKLPTHRAYSVKGEGEDAKWIELGAVWAHRDGKGFDVLLDAMPTGDFNGRLTLRAIDANKTKA